MIGTPHASTESWRGIMHLYATGVFVQPGDTRPASRGRANSRLRAVAAVMLALTAGAPSGFAQQATATTSEKQASNLPAAPATILTEPLNLRTSQRDFSKPAGRLLGNPIGSFKPTTIPKASFVNSVRLG